MALEISRTEEKYLKAIYKISETTQASVTTNAIADKMKTTAASVTDMLKKLAAKQLIAYERYKGSRLTSEGVQYATDLIRRHRLWETFLSEKLNFSWEEIHEIANELEHVRNSKLIEKLDAYLKFPKFDPHGDPIPNAEGKFTIRNQLSIYQLNIGETASVVGVKNQDTAFLQHLNNLGISLNQSFTVMGKQPYDNSVILRLSHNREVTISEKVSSQLLVRKD